MVAGSAHVEGDKQRARGKIWDGTGGNMDAEGATSGRGLVAGSCGLESWAFLLWVCAVLQDAWVRCWCCARGRVLIGLSPAIVYAVLYSLQDL